MRGKPIKLVPTDKTKIRAAAERADLECACGLWLVGDHFDTIVHEAGTTDYHIDQIVCHEIAVTAATPSSLAPTHIGQANCFATCYPTWTRHSYALCWDEPAAMTRNVMQKCSHL